MAIDPLLLEFAHSRPAELAELMADADAGELDTLIAALPAEAAARLAACLPSWMLSQLLAKQSPGVGADLLAGAKHDDAVTLVAHLRETRYSEILHASKPDQLERLRSLFEFPTLSLSALASPEFIRVDHGQLCTIFREELSASHDFQSRPVFAVDAHGVYQGIVNLLALFSSEVQQQKISHITQYILPLSGEMSASTALESPLWLDQSALPVTDVEGRIIGAVTRRQLVRLAELEDPAAKGLGLVVPEVATAYLRFCADVMNSLFVRGTK